MPTSRKIDPRPNGLHLKAELLLDYFIKEIGPYAYNRGVSDAESFFRSKLEDLKGSCHEYELTYWEEKKK